MAPGETLLLESLERERLPVAQLAANRLREAILAGEFGPGERLSDVRIAQQLGTSRGPIREALKVLEADGLVVHRPHRGTFVLSLSLPELLDKCELRVALETQAVRLLAAGPVPSRNLATLRHIEEALRRAAADEDHYAVSELDRQFHDHLCLLSGSRSLHRVYVREVRDMLGFFAFDKRVYRPLESMGIEFPPLLAAIEAGRQAEAAQFIETHIRRSMKLLSCELRHSIGDAEEGCT